MTVDIFQGQDFVRKQFPVQAVQVSPNNIDQMATAVKGEVKHDGDKEGNFSRTYIDVPVRKPINKRQTQAYIGDWIVKQGKTFKVYPDKNFHQQFETKNGVVTQKPRPNPKNHGKVGKGPNPASMPKKRTGSAGIASVVEQKIEEGKLPLSEPAATAEERHTLPEQGIDLTRTEQLVEGTKESEQELPIVEDDNGERIIQTIFGKAAPLDPNDVLVGGVPPELDRLNEKNIEVPQSDGRAPERAQLGDDELKRLGLPTSIQEGHKPVYVDELGDGEVEILAAAAHDAGVEAEKKLQEDLDQAEIDANVEAQLAQSPVEEPKKFITLDQLNTQAGDTRTAQQIMTERNQA